MSQSVAVESPRIFPTFRYRNPAAMIDWLVKTLGFSVHARYGEGEQIGHAELALGSSMIMLGQAADDAYGKMVGTPGENGGKSVYIVVDDADRVYERVARAGAEILEGLVNREYGSREFICRDPEGNVWCIGTYWPKAHQAQAET